MSMNPMSPKASLPPAPAFESLGADINALQRRAPK